MTRVFLIDVKEDQLLEKLNEDLHADLKDFKINSLPVLGYYDDFRKLTVVR